MDSEGEREAPCVCVFLSVERNRTRWELSRKGSVSGKRIHEVNLVATMLVNGVELLVTADSEDFRGFPEIRVVEVAELLGRL
jgi:hypothetical protein